MRLIDEQPTIEPDWTELMAICDNCGHAIHVKRTDAKPTIEERKKGKWIKYVSPINEDDGQDAWDCSECAAMVMKPYAYCPNCGARMEGRDETD